MKSKGFTLIELLISITIIALLAVLGLTGYSYFLKSARDAKRQSDLKIIQSALESYYADQVYYPVSDTLVWGSALDNTTGGSSEAVSKTYLTVLPEDPTNIISYKYTAYNSSGLECSSPGTCTKYCLFAQMESTQLTSDPGCTVLPAGFSAPNAYGVTRP